MPKYAFSCYYFLSALLLFVVVFVLSYIVLTEFNWQLIGPCWMTITLWSSIKLEDSIDINKPNRPSSLVHMSTNHYYLMLDCSFSPAILQWYWPWSVIITLLTFCAVSEATLAGKNGTIGCTDRQFRCADGTACIHMAFLCDGEAECPDKSDEDPRECFLKGKWEICWGGRGISRLFFRGKLLLELRSVG